MGRILLVATLVVGLTASMASAQVFCAKKRSDGTFNSAARVRSVCRSTETQVTAPALGVATPIVVKDANGALVGAAIEVTPGFAEITVARVLDGDAVLLKVQRDGLVPTDQVLFESTDCTGQPFVTWGTTNEALFYQGVTIGTTAFYTKGPPSTHTLRSSLFNSSEAECVCDGAIFSAPGVCCCHNPDSASSVHSAGSFDLTVLGLTPPFHVE